MSATPEELELWDKWARERALAAAKKPPVRRDADYHARAIRRAIADAERDGFVIEFDWRGLINSRNWFLAVCHKDVNWSKAVRIWPSA